jgi:citrate synthase
LGNYYFKVYFQLYYVKIATLEIDGQFELPVIVGSENEVAVDINKLRDLSG